MDDKLKDLDEKIAAFKNKESRQNERIKKQEDNADDMNKGLRAGAELIVTIAAGIFIGLTLDNWLATSPAFLLIFLFGGIAAGFFNIYRITQNFDSSVGFTRLPNKEKDAKRATEKDNEHA